MENKILVILESIEHCLLPRLARDQDETEVHAEFGIREHNLDTHFPILLKQLRILDFKIDADIASIVLPKLIILELELRSDGPWFREKFYEYSKELNQTFEMVYGIKLYSLLECNNVFNAQLLFDKCIEDLHKKITYTTFKKYPSLIEVYCKLLDNVKECKIKLNPMSVLPISFCLIEDYNIMNKIKGLKSCLAVLKCLTPADFSEGNYYEVIHGILSKCLVEKDLDVTNLTLACLLRSLSMLPLDVMVTKTDEVYKSVLEQMCTESNLYRKAVCFDYIKQIIATLGVHCVKRKLFKSVVCDALDVCSSETVAEILLQNVLECLTVWLQHSWCVWKLSSDQKILSMLFKILFLTSEDDNVVPTLQNLIMAMIQLCTKEEQQQICRNLEVFKNSQKSNESFLKNLEIIKKCISV